MERIISLFKRPGDDPALSDADQPAQPRERAGDLHAEPVYFQELLAYLRDRKQRPEQDLEPVNAE